MKFTCQHAHPLVPSYLDGELSEEQSAPLREHLFDCRTCREVAKDEKLFKRWFVDTEADALVPEGFAARVARRAFAGDPGLLEPAPAEPRPRGQLLPFLLKVSTVAAGLLLVLAVTIQRRGLPGDDDLRAEPLPPWERAEAQAERQSAVLDAGHPAEDADDAEHIGQPEGPPEAAEEATPLRER